MLSALLLALIPVDGSAAETYLLRHKYTEGGSTQVQIDHASAIDLRSPSGEQQLAHSSTTVRTATVERVKTDGTGVIVLSIDSTHMEADAPDSDKVVYDSKSGEEPPELFVGVAETIGKPLVRMTVTPAGVVEMAEDLVRGGTAGGGPSETAESVMHSNMQPYIPFPEEAIPVGEKWKDAYKVSVADESGFPVPVKMQRTFTLEQVESGVATIAFRTVVLTPLNDPKLESQVMKREMSGSLTFDIEAGRMTARKATGNRTVVGFAGAGTSMRTVSTRTEQVLDATQMAAGDSPTTK